MPVSFNQIPSNWRQPLYWVEVDPSKAGFPRSHQAALIVGTKTSAGIQEASVPKIVGRQADADRYFGQGSELANAFKAFFKNNFAHEVWGLCVDEPASGTAASGTLTVSTAPTEAGTIHLYVAGNHVAVGVASDDTVNDVATAIATAINDNLNLPVTASPSGAVVTITCRWKGTNGNDITLYDSYYGKIGGEELPVSLTLTYPANNRLSGGAGVPNFDTAIANMGEKEFEFVSLPYTDSTTLLAFEQEYGFSDTGRWGWMRQLYGHLFSARRGTYADLIAFGETRNAGVTSVMGIEDTTPTPVWEVSAAYTAKAARALINDPARPLQTLELTGMLSAVPEDRFVLMELNTLSNTGVATQRVEVGTTPMIARETTTYQLNLYGQGDDAYELVTTLATLAKLIRNQRHMVTSVFPRHKLADDGTKFGPGQAIVTPKIVKAALVAQYALDEWNGLVENRQAFKDNLLVERDSNDPNRLNVIYPPDLVNQLRIFAVLAQFRLQYNRGVDQAIIGTGFIA